MPFKLPELYYDEGTRDVLSVFAGLNRAPVISEGEFSDMKNMTSDGYPTLTVREPYGRVDKSPNIKPIAVTTVSPYGISTLCYLDPPCIYIGGLIYDIGISAEDQDRPKQIVRMGAYLIVLPDMVYINTADTGEWGKIEDGFTGSTTWSFAVVDFQGNSPDYEQQEDPKLETVKDSEGNDKLDEDGNKIYVTISNGATWHRTGSAPALLRWDEDVAKWEVEQGYLKVTDAIAGFSLKRELREGDAMRISGTGLIDGLVQIEKASCHQTDSGTWAVNYFTVPGMIDTTGKELDGTFTITRAIPVLDYACESGNRLWGCRYGENDAGERVNEIYCSALGDFFRWFMGDANDESAPVTFSVGTDGKFTGAVTYGGYPTFFKENYMHRVGGYLPSDFSVYTEKCPGVRLGCHRSLAVVNNVLYYKSSGAVMGFDGSSPVAVSEKLGNLPMAHAVGGRCGDKYYIHLRNNVSAKTGRLYVLDTTLGLWHAEGEDRIESMAEDEDDMYMIRVSGETHDILTVKPRYSPEGDVSWYAETGDIGMESPDRKYITRLTVKLSAEQGTHVRISVKYDSVGTWKQIFATEAVGVRPVTVPILPMPCDHFKLRLEGRGGCRIYNITKTMREGAERL